MVLGNLYPNGLDWLERRLDDVEAGHADLWQVGQALGWAIVTPKGPHEVKLSTFYIAPVARGRGLGSTLLRALVGNWRHRDILNASVTVDEDSSLACGFFEKHGFRPLSDGRRPYGMRFDRAYSLALDAPNVIDHPALEAVYPR
jgi:ribosomal protein S18 acetylase RimI-like enzyme